MQKRYIFDPYGRLKGEINAAGSLLKAFVYGSKSNVPDYYIDGAGVKFRIFSDHLGSVRLVINLSTGATAQRMEHDEFGRILQDTSVGLQPFGFAGGIYDSDTKLVRFGAREYDPETGRWLSKDPIGFGGGDTNLYGYVLQDPVNYIDPSGKFFQDFIARWTTPQQQAVFGTAAAAASIFLIYNSVNPLAPYTLGLGVFLGYEGARSLIKAKERGFVDDLMNDIIPRAEANQNVCK